MKRETPEHFCISYCQHGGVCVLERGHASKHNSDYCEWTDDESIPREEADALVYEKNPLMAPVLSLTEDLIMAFDPPEKTE